MTTPADRLFEITVLGRTLEHLGTQMYKRRDVAIAELVANAWDAGATEVRITIPPAKGYSQTESVVRVMDNGVGMTADQVDDQYLVIGRNRRTAKQEAPLERRVMGRKGVGKLAGFGLGRTMSVTTWTNGLSTRFDLDGATLRAEGGEAKRLQIPGFITPTTGEEPFPSGTEITMRTLKHKTPLNASTLHQSLARRFSRTVIGEMKVLINTHDLEEPIFNLSVREPVDPDGTITATLGDGNSITWWAGFSTTVLPSELQGFTVLVNGKTAQAPPYFFGVEGTASGQHGTKYLTGVIEADYLDEGTDDESDRISTDRQEIDWADETTEPLRIWGDAVTRRLLRERVGLGENRAETTAKADPEIRKRLEFLDASSRKQAIKFIRSIGGTAAGDEKILPLSDTIIRAFEYRQFHDFVNELDAFSEDATGLQRVLEYMQGWKVLESRAILEVIKGRIEIVDKFFGMLVNDASETAHVAGNDNLHDLVASYPWLLNPDWQVLSEEKTMSKQLSEWGIEDQSNDKSRYDFMALAGDGRTIVIEIKRGAHAVTLADLQQLERYMEKLSQARPNIHGVCITGKGYTLAPIHLKSWQDRTDVEMLTWGEIHRRTEEHYHHYQSILSGELTADSFSRKQNEVAMTRSILGTGSSYRSKEDRSAGLGPQDNDFQSMGDPTPEQESRSVRPSPMPYRRK